MNLFWIPGENPTVPAAVAHSVVLVPHLVITQRMGHIGEGSKFLIKTQGFSCPSVSISPDNSISSFPFLYFLLKQFL